MTRSALALLAVASLLVATFAGATLFAGPPRIKLSGNPSEADHVTLYQNGLAFVQIARTFVSDGGPTLLVFVMPLTGIFDSLKIEGGGIAIDELRSSLSASPIISPGDRLVVHVADQTYRGTVISFEGGRLLLASGNSTTLLDASKASAIEIEGRTVAESGPGSAEVTALVRAPLGNHTVHLSYLARGPGWTPTYAIDLDSHNFTFEATLTGLADWSNVTLDLVSGSPRVVYSPPSPNSYAGDQRNTGAGAPSATLSAADGFGSSTPLGDLHRYHLQRSISFSRGETVRLPVLSGPIEIARTFYSVEASASIGGSLGSAQRLNVLERVEVRNTLPEPLPPGIVRFYRDHTWVGEDDLPQLPKKDRTNLTISLAEEVKGELKLEQSANHGSATTFTWALQVTNFKDAAIDLHAALSYPTENYAYGQPRPVRDVRPDPPPTRLDGSSTEVWDTPLAAGQVKTFRVTFTAEMQRA